MPCGTCRRYRESGDLGGASHHGQQRVTKDDGQKPSWHGTVPPVRGLGRGVPPAGKQGCRRTRMEHPG